MLTELDAVCWMTYSKNEEPMFWPDRKEALLYCDEGEYPIPLFMGKAFCACGMPWEPDMDQFGCWSCGAEKPVPSV